MLGTFSQRVGLMAEELTRSTVDLGDEAAVIEHLQGAGFSKPEIYAGLDLAIDTARVERVNNRILAGLTGGDWIGAP